MGAMSDWIKWVERRSGLYVPGVINYRRTNGRIEASVQKIHIRDKVLIVEVAEAVTFSPSGSPHRSSESSFRFDLRSHITSPSEFPVTMSTSFKYRGQDVTLFDQDVTRVLPAM